MQILIVDDNADLKEAFRIVAEEQNVQITFCSSGEEALTEMAKDDAEFDVGVMDLAMYPMDGTSLGELIRSNEKVRQVPPMPLALYTAQPIDEVIEEIQRDLHIEKVFPKPITPMELVDLIKEWIH